MQEYVKKSDVIELLSLPHDMLVEYIYELKGIWIDDDWGDEPIKLGDRVDVIRVDRVCGTKNVAYVDGVFIAEDDMYYYIEKDNSYKMFPFNKHCYILQKSMEE